MARKQLLRQGLTIAPDRSERPDIRYPELDCRGGFVPGGCRALFIHRRSDGWGEYVVVLVKGDAPAVVNVDFAHTADGLLAIPPPPPADAPRISGPYLRAREQLKHLGFRPIMPAGRPGTTCKDLACGRLLVLPEAQCAGDVPLCKAFWRAPDGRVLKVTTVGEIRAGKVDSVSWVKRDEWR